MKLMIVFPASLGDVDMLLLYFNLFSHARPVATFLSYVSEFK